MITTKDKENIFQCDNLELMKSLKSNSIDLIYSDILYGTGRNFGEYQDLKPNKEEIYNFYVPRIHEMHRILKDTGLIYLQMDYRIVHWIRDIMDNTFGYHNFRNEIIWAYNSAPRKKLDFGKRHDIILRYSKSNIYTFNSDEVREPYSLTAPRGGKKEKYYHPKGKVMGDVWHINMLAQNDKTERTGYPTQKPLELMDRILLSSSNDGDTVADFFCGSGSFLVSAKTNNRNFIGCDNSNKAIEITKQRLSSIVSDRYKDEEF